MVKLIQKLGVGYDWLLRHPVALRLVTGALGLLLIIAVVALVVEFFGFFMALFAICVVLFVIYHIGNFVWEVIRA